MCARCIGVELASEESREIEIVVDLIVCELVQGFYRAFEDPTHNLSKTLPMISVDLT